jgi:hypothetical protein
VDDALEEWARGVHEDPENLYHHEAQIGRVRAAVEAWRVSKVDPNRAKRSVAIARLDWRLRELQERGPLVNQPPDYHSIPPRYTTTPPRNVYRFDSRPPAVVAANGFSPWNASGDLTLWSHISRTSPTGGFVNRRSSQWVSTGAGNMTEDTITGNLTTTQHLYRIDPRRTLGWFADVNATFGDQHDFARQHEFAYEGTIPPEAVIGYIPPNTLANPHAGGPPLDLDNLPDGARWTPLPPLYSGFSGPPLHATYGVASSYAGPSSGPGFVSGYGGPGRGSSGYGAPPVSAADVSAVVVPDQRLVPDFLARTPDGMSDDMVSKLRSLIVLDDRIEQPVSVRAELTRLAGRVFGAAAGPELVERIAAAGAGIVAVAHSTSIAEAAGVPGWPEEQRGWFDRESGRAYVAEENILGVSRQPASGPVGYRDGYSSAVHELAHLLFDKGLTEDQRAAVEAAHRELLAEGGDVAAGHYAASSVVERFAEAVTGYLGSGLEPAHVGLTSLLVELYGSNPVPVRGNNVAGALADEQNLTAAHDLDALQQLEASHAPQEILLEVDAQVVAEPNADLVVAHETVHELDVDEVGNSAQITDVAGVTVAPQLQSQPHIETSVAVGVQGTIYGAQVPRFGGLPAGVGWGHARFAYSWGLRPQSGSAVGTLSDALVAASGGSASVDGLVVGESATVPRALREQVDVAEPSAEVFSAAAGHLGASVLVLRGDGTIGAYGSGPILVVAEAAPVGGDGTQRWVGLPGTSADSALAHLSGSQVQWAVSQGKRFVGPRGGFFDALAAAGRASAVSGLDSDPKVLRDRLVYWTRTGLSAAVWDSIGGILAESGVQAPQDDAARLEIIASLQRGGGGDVATNVLLPLLASRFFKIGIQVIDANGGTFTFGASDRDAFVVLAPAVGSEAVDEGAWVGLAPVRSARVMGAGTRPADVAGGLSWDDAYVPEAVNADRAGSGAAEHGVSGASVAQQEWAGGRGRELVAVSEGPDAVFAAMVQAAGGGVSVQGQYVSDPGHLRELMAADVKPALEADLGISLVVHSIYKAHADAAAGSVESVSTDARIDDGRALDEIVDAVGGRSVWPGLADELVPFFAHRFGLSVRVVDPSGVVGQYGNGRPVYLPWTPGADGARRWLAAPRVDSVHVRGSVLDAPNRSDPALVQLERAIDAWKNTLRVGGAGGFGGDRAVGLLREARDRWLGHGGAPQSAAVGVAERVAGPWELAHLEDAAAGLVRDARAWFDGADAFSDAVAEPALGMGLGLGMAVRLFDVLFPHGIGIEPIVAGEGVVAGAEEGAVHGAGSGLGLSADQWVVASLPEVAGVLTPGGAALLLHGGRATVIVDTLVGQRLVEFGVDEVGGGFTGRVAIPTLGAPVVASGGLALVVDNAGHPMPAGALSDLIVGQRFDSAVGWTSEPKLAEAGVGTVGGVGATAGVSTHVAAWAERNQAQVVPVGAGVNSVFDAVLAAAGGVLSATDMAVTDASQLRQVLAGHLREKTAAANLLREFPSLHAAFVFEGVERVIEEFFGGIPAGVNERAVYQQVGKHIESGKAGAYLAQAVAEPGFWEQAAQLVALDAVADWAGLGVLVVGSDGEVHLHGKPDSPRLALARVASSSAERERSQWAALVPEDAGVEPFREVVPDTVTSPARRIEAGSTADLTEQQLGIIASRGLTVGGVQAGPHSIYHAVLDASGGAIQIDRQTLVTNAAQLKAQLTSLTLNRPDLLGATTRQQIERDAALGEHTNTEVLIDALADPANHQGEMITGHLIGNYLGVELTVLGSDGIQRTYGTGRPITIATAADVHTGNQWAALTPTGPIVELDSSQDIDSESGRRDVGAKVASTKAAVAAVEAELVKNALWQPETFKLRATGQDQTDPWRSATFCTTIVVDGVPTRACVSVAVFTLNTELATRLGVAMP